MAREDRPLPIEGADGGIVRATVTGPDPHIPEVFCGFEDYYHPRLKTLREKYRIGRAIRGESNEFRKILKLRRWVHRQVSGGVYPFLGDALEILEKTAAGHRFHCTHCMIVQQAVLSAFGLVARNLGVDRNFWDLGRSVHHGVNEVWSNDYAKWVLVDAEYDFHFERKGIPLSALEVHEAVRADGGRGILKVRGIRRRRAPMEEPRCLEATVRNYWWVSYHLRQDTFTHPHWSGGNGPVVFDSPAFRRTTWYRQTGKGRVRHWAYAADAFIRTDRHQVEWTPGVPALRARQVSPGELAVQVRSATPNFKTYRVRVDGGPYKSSTDGHIRWRLRRGVNTLEVHTRNLFGVDGPVVTVTVKTRSGGVSR